MSTKYPGGIITKTPVVPAGPYESGTAPGIWTLEQQMQYKQQGIWPLAGNAPPYIEDVFSTYLYTGTGAALTITNGIDLSTKGGLVWMKGRSGATDHALYDTARGATFDLGSNLSSAQTTQATGLTAFGSTGFTIGALAKINTSSATYASWTFRKQAKFFDIVTYTGNGTGQTILHNLQSTPGCIIVKATSAAQNWIVWHNAFTSGQNLQLDTTGGGPYANGYFATLPTSTNFTLSGGGYVNDTGVTYVAYLFAHDAGGFGLAGTDNVISCGSVFTTSGGSPWNVNLGWEPQYVLIKKSSGAQEWYVFDIMRGMSLTSASFLFLNLSADESVAGSPIIYPTATGFQITSASFDTSSTYIYIAIRRGPMKVPTDATKVFNSLLITGNGANRTVTGVGFPTDLFHSKARNIGFANSFYDRLRGATKELVPNSTAIENTDATSLTGFDVQDGVRLGTDSVGNATVNYPGGYNYVEHYFRRAPSFFDEVCYTGTGTLGQTYSHNLGVAPELIILKCRAGGTYSWPVWNKDLADSGSNRILRLDQSGAFASSAGDFNSTAPTASVFTVGNNFSSNGGAGYTYVAYLFATCAGVSKVGTYTGTGTTQTINCGFTAGARFVLIKRTDVAGDWYVWDTVRGIIAGNDPYLLLNSVAAEDTSTDYIDTAATGFEISSTAPAAINANAGTYIFLAIA